MGPPAPGPGPTTGRPTLRARTATHRDADTVGRLLHDFNTEFGAATPTADALGQRFRRLLAMPEVLVVLAEDDDAPAGFAFLTLRPTPYDDGPLAQLEELYVRPGLRDQGIGTALLTVAVDGVRTRGAREMHIDVDEVDVDTRRFYERHGFTNIEPGGEYRMLCYLREF
ncbi:GNAT family N-acetyltransferase [Arthrobacter agilis]|uniref:GNAT family N-acetyltransferase n=1 Tax=Arthrobacter agilis TaxID=37921 RepID=UPI002786F90D|nr:GNAT family N-acetyltransferase [Arthrobacter agilis]MDQ0734486.1 GNAT superfamily N-acetyltransferase [Arthrobacter agilis]